MQFSWSTFIIEIINFLILVWILKRLLYIPVKKAILQRSEAITATITAAEKLKIEAQELETKFTNRLNDWEEEKRIKKKDLAQEIEELKARELAKLADVLHMEKEANTARENLLLQTQIEKNLQESMLLATKFSAKFLQGFADPDLEKKIVLLFTKSILHLGTAQIDQLKGELPGQTIQIQSVYSLDEAQKQLLEDNFTNILEKKINLNFSQNTELLAGITVQIGSILFQASLRDELKYFASVANESL